MRTRPSESKGTEYSNATVIKTTLNRALESELKALAQVFLGAEYDMVPLNHKQPRKRRLCDAAKVDNSIRD